MTDFFAPYRSLRPVERVVAMVCGVVQPNRLTPEQLLRLLARAGIRMDRVLISLPQCRAACRAGEVAGILCEHDDSGEFSAWPDWAPWLTVQAHAQRKLAAIQGACRTELSVYGDRFRHRDRDMVLRCHAVAGRFSRIEADLDAIDEYEWAWLASPGVADILAKLPAEYAGTAAKAVVTRTITEAVPPGPVIEALRRSRADAVQVAADEAFLQILLGRPDNALAAFADLPGEVREGKPARVARASTRALLATLRGDHAGAAELIDESVARERAGTRKRNVFPPYRAFALSLVSLARNHSPDRASKTAHFLKLGRKSDADALSLHIFTMALHVGEGGSVHWSRYALRPDIDRLVEGWAACWTNDFSAFPGDRFRGLTGFAAAASANGYRWLLVECLDVMARINAGLGDVPGIHDRVALAGEPVSPAEAAGTLLAKVGTTPLASLISPADEWEYDLRAIEQLAYDTAKKRPKGTGAAGAGVDRRLAWVIGEDRYGNLAATPREQRAGKGGRWSKGRVVALKRLQTQAGKMGFLIDQDRAAAAEIVHNEYRWSRHPPYYLPIKGFFALAGHPYLFDEHGESIEIVAREPELLLEERGGVVRAGIDPHPGESSVQSYAMSMVSDVRWEITHFSKSHKKLCAVIPPDGLELPEAGRERLVKAVSVLADDIRVQGVIGDGAEVARQVDADPQSWVRLEPSGPGLTVTVLVEPVPGSGAYFQPGVGGTTTFATIDGKAVQARRDLAAEDRAVDELMLACPMLSGAGPDLSLTIADPGECIELVDQLDAADARCLWPRGQPFRVVARADTNALRLQVKSAADWFSATGTLAVDKNHALDLRALFELIDRNPASRFVPVGDGAFVSLAASFRRQLDDLRSLSVPSGKQRLRIHGLAALSLQEFFEGTELAADKEWSNLLGRVREARSFEPRVPGTLQAELRPYQEDGFRWLARMGRWGAGACLADDMGLGKTVQTLAALLDRATNGPALVVAPTSVVHNWLDEARRFAPTLNVRAYTGPAAARARRLDGLGPFDLVVTTYGLLRIDAEVLTAIDWHTVVLDEAQAIRNPGTKRARTARKLKASFRVVTTGTPIQNSLVDLYSLFAFLNPGMLGSGKHFRENFALPVGRDGDPAARKRLRRLISPFVLRRVKADVLDDLPPRTEVTLHVEMSAEEAALYEALRQRAMEDLEALAQGGEGPGDGAERGRRRLQVLAHLTRLRLACCNPRLVDPDGPPSSKLRTFATTLDELRRGRHKVLVFSQFVRHLKLIEEHLTEAGIPYQYLDGSTPAKVRSERIAAFQAGEGDAFLISLKAGGVGLNLTAADYVIHMDPWWNPAAEDQASDRAHRIGQTRPVTIYRLVAKGTIEEQIVELHRSKRELADRLLEGADTPAGLSTEELLKLLRE